MPDDLPPVEELPVEQPPVEELPVEQPPVEQTPSGPSSAERALEVARVQRVERAVNKTSGLSEKLAPLIRDEDLYAIRDMANTGDLAGVLEYLKRNIPDVDKFLRACGENCSDEELISAIESGLKARAESMVPAYDMPAPFLGSEVEEARDDGDIIDVSTRYKTQYENSPSRRLGRVGRGTIVSPYYNHKSPYKKNTKIPGFKLL